MNPFLIGIPGFFIAWLVGYVLVETALKYLSAEQIGNVVLRVRKARMRTAWALAGLMCVFLATRLISREATVAIAPYFFIVLILGIAWYSWHVWRDVKELRTPEKHLRLFGASLAAGTLAIVFFAGACAATSFVPAEWLGPSKNRAVPNERKREHMSIDRFWAIVDRVHERAGRDLQERIELLEEELDDLETGEIADFERLYEAQIARAHRWELWGAAYVMNGGCSDDCFRYFRDWLISEGRATFEAALESPDSLAQLPRAQEMENELFGYVARRVFEKKGGGELPHDTGGEAGDPLGRPWDEKDLSALFPRLHEKYGG